MQSRAPRMHARLMLHPQEMEGVLSEREQAARESYENAMDVALYENTKAERNLGFEEGAAELTQALANAAEVAIAQATEFSDEDWDSALASDVKPTTFEDVAVRRTTPAKAQIIDYADYSEDRLLTCSICEWKGTPRNGGILEYHHDLLDVSCPICDKMLLIVSYPRT